MGKTFTSCQAAAIQQEKSVRIQTVHSDSWATAMDMKVWWSNWLFYTWWYHMQQDGSSSTMSFLGHSVPGWNSRWCRGCGCWLGRCSGSWNSWCRRVEEINVQTYYWDHKRYGYGRKGRIHVCISGEFDAYDINRDGQFVYEEFAFTLVKMFPMQQPEEFRGLFQEADLNYEPRDEKTCFCHMPSAQSDQRLCCSLLRSFNIYIQNFKTLASPCSWAGLFDFSGSQTPKTGFLVTWLIYIIFWVLVREW